MLTCIVLLIAFSTGSVILLSLGVLSVLLTLACLVSVWQVARTLRVELSFSHERARRGDQVTLHVDLWYRGWLPIAPLQLVLCGVPRELQGVITVQQTHGKGQRLSLPFQAAHVGLCRPGVETVKIEDVFSRFSFIKRPVVSSGELLVLPSTFPIEPLNYAMGDSGTESMARAMEDVTSPSDVRGYQPGDAIKKIHWKLSMRKQELLVRRFEEPELPDTLVLLDCSAPDHAGDAVAPEYRWEMEQELRDALLDTAASVMAHASGTRYGAHLPLQGTHPMELDKAMGMPLVMESLARVDFSETESFERVLLLETRRMRRVGCTVVMTTRLNSSMVDLMVRMRRLGPYVRLYLISFDHEDQRLMQLVSRLQRELVEVCFVMQPPGQAHSKAAMTAEGM